ncbi:MAG: hypothetical protein BWZ10_03347 [candidate division BRC1 bacterium ADurb.BinA364]|nr:MAG: hypothetical protein BWZ10_03347 [candidate division BRC1 bacterium ADurb.BinA364]
MAYPNRPTPNPCRFERQGRGQRQRIDRLKPKQGEAISRHSQRIHPSSPQRRGSIKRNGDKSDPQSGQAKRRPFGRTRPARGVSGRQPPAEDRHTLDFANLSNAALALRSPFRPSRPVSGRSIRCAKQKKHGPEDQRQQKKYIVLRRAARVKHRQKQPCKRRGNKPIRLDRRRGGTNDGADSRDRQTGGGGRDGIGCFSHNDGDQRRGQQPRRRRLRAKIAQSQNACAHGRQSDPEAKRCDGRHRVCLLRRRPHCQVSRDCASSSPLKNAMLCRAAKRSCEPDGWRV